jgi:protease-4
MRFLGPRRAVTVLTLEGNIVPGEGDGPFMAACGAEPAVRALSALREEPRVAAVVLHVDSRGGSAAASDRIWREVSRLAAAKPVVAYLGDVAASGGYYVAAPCGWIVAQPTTLTGSIGVVAGKFSVERLLDRLGVGSAILTRGRAAAMNSFRRGYDEEERARLRAELEATYRQFLEKVAAGRKFPVERADEVGRGRVWLGQDAATRGLVDQVGSLAEAVTVAEGRARRRPRERFALVDVHLHPRRAGLLASLSALSRERALLLGLPPEIV